MATLMPFPNFRNKHGQDALITPRDYIAYVRARGRVPKTRPEALIIAYQRSVMQYVLENHPTKRVRGFFREMFLLGETDNRVAIVGDFGIGAPQAVIYLEEFIEWGVRRFISIGTAGSLQKHLRVGDVILCERAIRDEGSSHHYIPAARYAYPSKRLTEAVRDALRARKLKFACGTTWTIDTPYRETIAEARRYQKQGVLTVEMEAAALFAVAKYRKVNLAALFSISDSLVDALGGASWRPRFHSRRNLAGLERIFQIAVHALHD